MFYDDNRRGAIGDGGADHGNGDAEYGYPRRYEMMIMNDAG